MGMTIDEALEILDYIPTIGDQVDALEMAIETMCKYQRIQAIINNAKDSDGAVKYNWLYEQIGMVIEDGKEDTT